MPEAPTISQVMSAAGIEVFVRGWLSANNTLIRGDGPSALIDSGYASHAAQTVALVHATLQETPLNLLLNTHLHSDHCGGNAALQGAYPALKTHIPPGQSDAVARWDPVALTYTATGQSYPRFEFHGLLVCGSEIQLGSHRWEVHGAKGHDPHAIVLFQAEHRVLISADALWENGFGVVFPELEGLTAFDEVAETLDLIERLQPQTVIPGHGALFQDLPSALLRERSRLNGFIRNPQKHHRHALKVLVKFHLLECQRISREEMFEWAKSTPYLRSAIPLQPEQEAIDWFGDLLMELERSAALRLDNGWITNC